LKRHPANRDRGTARPAWRLFFGIVLLLSAANRLPPDDSRSKSAAKAEATSRARPSLLQQTLDAWRARQSAVRCARFEWKNSLLVPAEQVRRLARRPGMDRELQLPLEKLNGTATVQQKVFVFEGSRTRYEERGPVRLFGTNNYLDRVTFSVFDGHKHVHLTAKTPPTAPGQKFDAVVLDDTNSELIWAMLQPLFLNFQAFDRSPGTIIDPDKLVVEPGPRDQKSRKFELRHDNWIVTVDPDRDFTIAGYRQESQDRTWIVFEMTIDYDKNAQGLWVPKSWQSNVYTADGNVRSMESATVTRSEINPTLPASTFQLDIPVNAYCRDYRHGEQKVFIQLPEGKQFPVSPTMTYPEAVQKANADVSRRTRSTTPQ
jgi:hypothetical protein